MTRVIKTFGIRLWMEICARESQFQNYVLEKTTKESF